VSCSLADRKDLEQVVLELADDARAEFLYRKITHCVVCSAATCGFGVTLKVSGKKHHFCSRFNYMCHNPTAEQFRVIEQFIDTRRKYIDSKK
jgi:hypothetical protein